MEYETIITELLKHGYRSKRKETPNEDPSSSLSKQQKTKPNAIRDRRDIPPNIASQLTLQNSGVQIIDMKGMFEALAEKNGYLLDDYTDILAEVITNLSTEPYGARGVFSAKGDDGRRIRLDRIDMVTSLAVDYPFESSEDKSKGLFEQSAVYEPKGLSHKEDENNMKLANEFLINAKAYVQNLLSPDQSVMVDNVMTLIANSSAQTQRLHYDFSNDLMNNIRNEFGPSFLPRIAVLGINSEFPFDIGLPLTYEDHNQILFGRVKVPQYSLVVAIGNVLHAGAPNTSDVPYVRLHFDLLPTIKVRKSVNMIDELQEGNFPEFQGDLENVIELLTPTQQNNPEQRPFQILSDTQLQENRAKQVGWYELFAPEQKGSRRTPRATLAAAIVPRTNASHTKEVDNLPPDVSFDPIPANLPPAVAVNYGSALVHIREVNGSYLRN